MYRKGLGSMDTLDNACMGAKSIRPHPLGESTNKGSAPGQGALEQPQTIQLTCMYSQKDLGVYIEKVTSDLYLDQGNVLERMTFAM